MPTVVRKFWLHLRTPRHDWRGPIAASGLPDAIQTLIVRVIRRASLLPAECLEVAQELITQFRSGLSADRSTEELLAEFGPLRGAAKRIHRERFRRRSRAMRFAYRCAQAFAVVMVTSIVAYAIAVLVMGRRHPEPRVDYLAVINERSLAAPESERAWPLYRAAMTRPAYHAVDLDDLCVPIVVPERPDAMRWPRPGEPGWERLAAMLDREQPTIEEVRRAAARPTMGLPARLDWQITGEDRNALYSNPNPPGPAPDRSNYPRWLAEWSTMRAWSPAPGILRRFSALLDIDMQLAAARGDGARVVADYRAALGMARHIREQPRSLYQFYAMGIRNGAICELMDVLDQFPRSLSDEQIAELARMTRASASIADPDISGDLADALDFIQRIYSDDGHGNGSPTYDGYLMLDHLYGDTDRKPLPWQARVMIYVGIPALSLSSPSRAVITAYCHQYVDLAGKDFRRPLWEVLHQPLHSVTLKKSWEEWQNVSLYPIMVLPLNPFSVETMGTTLGSDRGVSDAFLVALALEQFRREHGQFPQQLSDLAPRYLDAPPVDHSTGGPLRYKLVNGRPLLYGLGKDGKDDGGVWSEPALWSNWPRVPTEGDWVLYPPLIAPVDQARAATRPAP